MTDKPKQIKALDLVKQVFEHIYGNLTLLRFNVEKLTPINSVQNSPDINRWEVIVNFYQNLQVQQPNRYKIDVDLIDNTVSFCSVDSNGSPKEDEKQTFQVVKKEGNKKEDKFL